MENLTEYAFTADELEGLRPVLDQAKEIENEMNAALRFIVRTRKLKGNWILSPDKTKLVPA